MHFAPSVSRGTLERITAKLRRHGIEPGQFLMVGNSLKSDIQPVLALGGLGAYIPYHLTWAAEHLDEVPVAPGRFFTLGNVRDTATPHDRAKALRAGTVAFALVYALLVGGAYARYQADGGAVAHLSRG